MKIILIFLLFQILNCQNNIAPYINNIKLKNKNFLNVIQPNNNITTFSNKIVEKLSKLIMDIVPLDLINIKEIDKECISFLINIRLDLRNFINEIAKQILRNGFITNSMEIEEECIENDKVFFLFKGNYS